MLLRWLRRRLGARELMNRAAGKRIDGDDMPELTIKSIGGEALAADARETAPATGQTDASAIPENAIARRAYELWLDRGCPEGSPEEDWYQAVLQLTPIGQATATSPQRPAVETAGPGESSGPVMGGRSAAGRQRSPSADLLRHA